GETILLVGAPEKWGTHLGQSALLYEIFGQEDGPPPPVDLAHEKKTGEFVRGLIRDGLAAAVHDCSAGGLALALAEMAMASGIGAKIVTPPGQPLVAFFGEDQGRYVVTTASGDADKVIAAAGDVSVLRIGTTGGDELKLGDTRPLAIGQLRERHESWFPRFMGPAQAEAAE
ncbi:MAG: phosphoribosylformylglycinamidine synthase II, partial [Hyphomicrobiaceae bacterium]|nr:phosphoribosylformylglycinamidine synthase II [Hyphomicrobiaceae bacterium]